MKIHFGTDGWRGIISDDFTFDNVRRVGQAVADYVRAHEGKWIEKADRLPVVIGYDTRFLSNMYAEELARVVGGNAIPVLVSCKPVATPAISYATRNLPAQLGLMVTASHNPPYYNGIKIKADYGGAATDSITREIESYLREDLPALDSEHRWVGIFEPDELYCKQIRSLINWEAISKAGLTVVVDAMYGAGSGYLDRFLEEAGVNVVRVRTGMNPGFGGINPEPVPPNLKPLVEKVQGTRAHLGLALDGDGDRIGVVDERGRFVDAHRVFVLLLWHLVKNRHLTGAVARTFSTTRMVVEAARDLGLALYETPIGFKHICAHFLQHDVLIGGEESGGFGFKMHVPDRDGILAGLLLVEFVSLSNCSLSELVDEMLARYGPSYYRRVDLPLITQRRDKLFSVLKLHPPSHIAGLPVTRLETLDGVKFWLGDRNWILFRSSGTEPLLRIYVEAETPQLLEEVLETGREIALYEKLST